MAQPVALRPYNGAEHFAQVVALNPRHVDNYPDRIATSLPQYEADHDCAPFVLVDPRGAVLAFTNTRRLARNAPHERVVEFEASRVGHAHVGRGLGTVLRRRAMPAAAAADPVPARVTRFLSFVVEDNPAMYRVLAKCGFRRVAECLSYPRYEFWLPLVRARRVAQGGTEETATRGGGGGMLHRLGLWPAPCAPTASVVDAAAEVHHESGPGAEESPEVWERVRTSAALRELLAQRAAAPDDPAHAKIGVRVVNVYAETLRDAEGFLDAGARLGEERSVWALRRRGARRPPVLMFLRPPHDDAVMPSLGSWDVSVMGADGALVGECASFAQRVVGDDGVFVLFFDHHLRRADLGDVRPFADAHLLSFFLFEYFLRDGEVQSIDGND